jgi:photosystem I subunit III
MKKLFAILSLGFVFSLTSPQIALADIAGLTPCSESSVYTKKLNSSLIKLENRLKKYEVDSEPSLALQKQIEKTKQRFDRYQKSGLLCGNDGLPHLIVDGRWDHAAEFTLPSLMFLYITGWIGWVGRKYLRTISKQSEPTQKEIIIDLPIALSIITSGYCWPLSAWQEFTSGDLLAKNEDITVSPR